MLMSSRVLCLLGLFAVCSIGGVLCYARGDLQGQNEQVTRVKEKAADAVSGVQQLASEAVNVTLILAVLKEVKTAGDSGNLDKAEQLLDQALVMITEHKEGTATSSGFDYDGKITKEFKNPLRVNIRGYTGHAMEPFLSRDGQSLFFNNLNDASENTNIHVARYIDNRTFEYLGEVKGINTEVLEGVPTVDTEGNIYFTSLRNYGKDFLTLYHARYSNGAVTDVSVLKGDFSRQQAPWLNMDSEISADGQTLYTTINRFDQTRNMMIYSNFLVLRKKGERFFVDPGSDELMANINTEEMEYAASISADELELFFTRATGLIQGAEFGGVNLRSFISRRSKKGEPWGVPELIDGIHGFAEAPTISEDGKRIYYHKKVDGKFYIHVLTRD